MDQIPRYIKGKQNPGHNEYTHPALEPILNVTYGCMVYQEQVMQIVRDLAGYSLGRADLVRRAMGKKKLDVMAKEREIFINGQVDEEGNVVVPGCVRNGIDEKSANKIFDEMAEFAKYAFNKSHAAAYAVLSYQTAYLKTYYPTELLAAMLNSYLGNLDKIPYYIEECKRLKIEILKPDINKSFTEFTVENDENKDLNDDKEKQNEKIRFGLASIKNVGIAVVDSIVEEREKNGEYKSFTDFCERIQDKGVNKRCIESLIKAGAFDNFEQTRSTLMASFEDIIDTITDSSKKAYQGQVSMFDLGGLGGNESSEEDDGNSETQNDLEKMKYNFTTLEEYSDKEILSMEKEMLGIYVSGHPLSEYRELIEQATNISTLKIKEAFDEYIQTGKMQLKDNQNVRFAGIINSIKKKYTKNNKLMAFITIEDLYGSMEIIAFENTFQSSNSSIIEENIVLVEGRLSIKEEDGTASIIASKIAPLNDTLGTFPKVSSVPFVSSNNSFQPNNMQSNSNFQRKTIKIKITNLTEEQKDRLRGALKFFMGDRRNTAVIIINDGKELPSAPIFANEKVIEEITEIVGKENIE